MKLENLDFRGGTTSSSCSNFQGMAMGESNRETVVNKLLGNEVSINSKFKMCSSWESI